MLLFMEDKSPIDLWDFAAEGLCLILCCGEGGQGAHCASEIIFYVLHLKCLLPVGPLFITISGVAL